MDRATRITMLTEAARALNQREWGEMDLILRTFDCPTREPWDVNQFDYAIGMLQEINDVDLVELHEMLTGKSEMAAPDIAGPWEPGYVKLFMSHIHQHRQFVADVKRALITYGIDSFVAHDDIEPSQEWMNEIKIALSTCDAIAAFLHPGFRESQWCDQEIGYCLPRRVLVMPLMFGDPPHGFLSQWQGDKCLGAKPAEVALKIYKTCMNDADLRPKLEDGLLAAFENAATYNDAADLAARLYNIKEWTHEKLLRVENALKNNDQIHGSFKAEPRVRTLIKQQRRTVPDPREPPF